MAQLFTVCSRVVKLFNFHFTVLSFSYRHEQLAYPLCPQFCNTAESVNQADVDVIHATLVKAESQGQRLGKVGNKIRTEYNFDKFRDTPTVRLENYWSCHLRFPNR